MRLFPHLWLLITWFVARVSRRVPHVEQGLLTLPEHLCSPSGMWCGSCCSILSLMFCILLFVFFGYYIVCPSIHGFWYLQTFLKTCGRSVVFSGHSGFHHNKTDRHDITEILLKLALNTINQTKPINRHGFGVIWR
jgi:hypothetical protein